MKVGSFGVVTGNGAVVIYKLFQDCGAGNAANYFLRPEVGRGDVFPVFF